MWYNVRVKTYPDGHKQYMWSEKPILRDIPDECKPKKRTKIKVPGIDEEGRRRDNMSHSINNVYDLARSNDFNWFITLTFDKRKVNRYDYDECSMAIRLFTKRLYKLGCKWLIVPEQHEKGGYHFHGEVQGDLPLTPSGKTCYNEAAGQQVPIYNLTNYEYGFTTVTKIYDQRRTSSYIAKYLTKKIAVPKGRKCYWASKSLARPEVDYLCTRHDDMCYDPETGETHFTSWDEWSFGLPPGPHPRFVKEINGPYGRFVISEE